MVKYDAIEKKNKAKYETPTIFGNWLKKTNMDIELGYYFNKFKINYPMNNYFSFIYFYINKN